MINSLVVISQAVASLLFLLRWLTVVRFWETVHNRVITGLAVALNMITITLALTNSNEGLGNSPIAVTIGRLLFSVVCLYGLFALDEKPWWHK